MIYKISSSGAFTTLFTNFTVPNGTFPNVTLALGSDGNFYGTTQFGSSTGGVLFEITSSGAYSVVTDLPGSDPDTPNSGVTQGTDGNFYGTTISTIYNTTPAGLASELGSIFGGNLESVAGPLLQATDGDFYGILDEGGTGSGSIFTLSNRLGPFVALVTGGAKPGSTIGILGHGLTETTTVSVNGQTAKFRVESNTFLTATVPTSATDGFVTVTTASATLQSNRILYIRP
jgi:hypothetical protein